VHYRLLIEGFVPVENEIELDQILALRRQSCEGHLNVYHTLLAVRQCKLYYRVQGEAELSDVTLKFIR
jgi:hypothetical protein